MSNQPKQDRGLMVKLISQIDMNHWTVQFMEGEWKGQVGDYRLPNCSHYDAGQMARVKVEHYPKYKGPSTNGYCGRMELTEKRCGSSRRSEIHQSSA